jgi:methyl-accepting chemotaxis protein
MRVIDNVKTGPKLIGGFVAAALFLAVVGGTGWFGLQGVAGNERTLYTTKLLPLRLVAASSQSLYKMRGDLYKYVAVPKERDQSAEALMNSADEVRKAVDEFRKTGQLGAEETRLLGEFEQGFTEYSAAIADIVRDVEARKMDAVSASLGSGGAASIARKKAGTALEQLVARTVTAASALDMASEATAARATRLMIVATVVGLLFAIAIGVVLTRSLTRPLEAAVRMMNEMARGHLGLRLNMVRTDEVGCMARAMDGFAKGLQTEVLGAMQKIAAGDLTAEVAPKDDQDEIAPALSSTLGSLRALVAEAKRLTAAAVDGQLATRGDAERFQGAYREIVQGVNATLDAVVGPLNVAAEYVDRIAKGDIPAPIVGAYRGDFNEIKNNLNACVAGLGGLVEANRVLQRMAVNDLTSRVEGTYQGVFAEVGNAVNDVRERLLGIVETVEGISCGNLAKLDHYRSVGNGTGRRSENDRLVPGFIRMMESVDALVKDANTLSAAAIEGRLATRADASRHAGEFKKVIDGVNATLDVVVDKVFWYEQLLDAVPFPVSVTDMGRKWTFINKPVEDLLGVKRQDVLGRACHEWKASICRTKDCGIECLRAGRPRTEFEQAGHSFQVDVGFIHNAKGDQVGHIEVVQDTTAKVRVAEYQAREVDRLAKSLHQFAEGDLSFETAVAVSEDAHTAEAQAGFRKIAESLGQARDAVTSLVADAAGLAAAAVDGKLATRADAARHRGDFRKVVDGVNQTLDAVIGPLNVAAEYVDRISKGDIPPAITDTFRGDFNELKANLNTCIAEIGLLVDEVGTVIQGGRQGNLSRRADADRVRGVYRKLLRGINDTLTAVVTPVNEAAAVLERIAHQDLAVSVQGDYAGDHAAMKTSINTMVADLRGSMQSIGENARQLAGSSENLTAISHRMSANAEETATQTHVVSAASDEVSKNLTVVATSSEEMLASIREIAKSANEAARMAKNAVGVADATNQTVQKLGDSSQEIGNVIKVITSIAEQTNLLALNATIEAARAGDAGKGFAVVANEVKELAKATARATEEIGQKIEAIQADTRGAVQAIGQISAVITQIDDVSTTIASAVEEQTATTNEIGRNISEAARGASEIAKNVSAVATAAQSTAEGATSTQQAAQALRGMAAQLQALVGRFKV